MRSLILGLGLFISASSYAQLTLENPRVRAMPPGQPNTAAFMVVKNSGDKDIKLTSVNSTISKKSEFHQHKKNAQGVLSMSKVDAINVKAGDSFTFKSGEHHIMIMGLKKMLKPGETVQIELVDDQGKIYPFDFPVVSIMQAQEMEHAHHHH
jgi:copper(I)-binding protein